MKKLLAIAALLLASTAAQAQYTFEYGGRTIRVDPDRGTVSIPGVYDNSGRKARRSRNEDTDRPRNKTPQQAKTDPQQSVPDAAPSATAPAPSDQAATPAATADIPTAAAPTAPAAATTAEPRPQRQPPRPQIPRRHLRPRRRPRRFSKKQVRSPSLLLRPHRSSPPRRPPHPLLPRQRFRPRTRRLACG